MVLQKCGDEVAGWTLRQGGDDGGGPVVIDHVEKLIVLLREGVNPQPRVAAYFDPGHVGLPAFIFRGTVVRRGAGYVIRRAVVVGAVVMKEGRHGEHEPWGESANPREGSERIVLAIAIAKDRCWIARINRHLIKIAARMSDQAKMVLWIQVEAERSESAEAVGRVVSDRGSRSLQPEIGAIAAQAGVIGEAIRVAAEIDLIIRLIKVAGGEDEFGFVVAFESGAWGDIENAVGAVAVVRGVAAALRLQRVNVPGIDLRAEGAGDVGVRDRDDVEQPTDLVPAADVELVVRQIGAGDVVGNHREAGGPRGAGSFLNLQAIDEACRRDSLRLRGVGGDNYGLALRGWAQLKMKNRSCPREH